MSQITIKIEGLAPLTRALNGDMRRAARLITFPIAQQVKQYVAHYPALTDANTVKEFSSGGNNRWYERGWGAKWARKDGTWGGRRTSEKLNESWAVGRSGIDAYAGSKASYSPAVHSWEEQAGFHGARGWRTDQQAVDFVKNSGAIDIIVKQAVDKVLGGK